MATTPTTASDSDTGYVVRRSSGRVVESRIGHQRFRLTTTAGGDHTPELSEADGHVRKLSEDEVAEVARLGVAIEKHYGAPQDIEWAYAEASSASCSRAPSPPSALVPPRRRDRRASRSRGASAHHPDAPSAG